MKVTTTSGKKVDRMRFHHKGIDATHERIFQKPTHLEDDIQPPNRMELEFDDMYEVDALIKALTEFREYCALVMGTFESKMYSHCAERMMWGDR